MTEQDERLDFLIEKFKEDSKEYQNISVGNSAEEKKRVLR